MLGSLLLAAAVTMGGMIDLTISGTLPAAAMKDAGNGPAIVHIVSREQTLTVRSGQSGLLYSLTATNGKVLVADATPDEFARLHPDLYRQVRHFIAVKSDTSEIGAYDGVSSSAAISIANIE